MSLLIAALTVSALLQTSMGQLYPTLLCDDEVSGHSLSNVYNFTNNAVQDVLFSTCGSSTPLRVQDNFELHYGTGSSYPSDYSRLGLVTGKTSDYCDDEAYELYVEDMAAGSYLVALIVDSDDDTTTTMAPEDPFDLYAVCGDDDLRDFFTPRSTPSPTQEDEDSADLSPLSCGDEVSGNSSSNGYNFTNDAVQDVLFTTCGSSASLNNFILAYGTGSIDDATALANVNEMTSAYCDDGDAYELYVEDLAAGSYLVGLYVKRDDNETTTMAPEDSFDLSVVCGDDDIDDFYSTDVVDDGDSAVRVSMAMVMSLVSVVMAMFE